jgi:penicillin G amidase
MAETHSTTPLPIRRGARRRRRRPLRRLAWFAAVLVAVVLMAASAGVLWLYLAERDALPATDGTLTVTGLSSPVIVQRDAHGVPHIEAAAQDDLWVAQGYVTAQERLWQMDMFRRRANGELAEVLGPKMLEQDRIQRFLLIRKTAERIYHNLPADDRRRLDEYASGVNAFIAQNEAAGHLPAEFRLLHYQPKPWTGADSVSVGMMEVQELDTHAASKLNRWLIRAKLNNPQLEADLYPVGSWRDHPPTGTKIDLTQPQPVVQPRKDDDDDDDENAEARNGASSGGLSLVPSQVSASRPEASAIGDKVTDDEVAWEAFGRPVCAGCAVGSNEWVIAGSHTASGKPLLSNDMHIQVTEPNIWYMVALRAPGFNAAGVTFPGFPFIIAGHNEHVAWGFTDLYADVQDLYFENLDGKGNYQAIDGSWKPLSVDRETIHVRGGKDVTVDVPADRAQVEPLRSIAQHHSGVRNGCGVELGAVFRHIEGLELARAEPGLRRRPGTYCLSCHWQSAAAAGGADGRADCRQRARMARLYSVRFNALGFRSAFGISGDGQLARDDRRFAVSAGARVDRALQDGADLQDARRPERPYAGRHARGAN